MKTNKTFSRQQQKSDANTGRCFTATQEQAKQLPYLAQNTRLYKLKKNHENR